MPNTFLTPEIVAKEALLALQSNLVMAELVHRDYAEEFASVGDTITIRKPAKFVAKNFTGSATPQDITEGSVPVKLDRFRDVTVAVDAKQMTLDIGDFSRQVVTPAMQAIAQAVDEDLLAAALAGAGYVKEATPEPKDLGDIADLAKRLDLNRVPLQNRRLVLSPTHKYRYALTDNLSKVSYAGNNRTLRDALLGRVYTLETYMDQNAPDTSAAAGGTATAFSVTGSAGAEQVSLSGVTPENGTLKAGDAFVLGGYLYRIKEDAAAEGGSAEVKLDQPLAAEATGEAATPVTGPHSLAFHRNGLALVTRRLALPMGAARAAYASAGGLAVRVVYDYDSATKTDKISFDILYGIQALEPAMICALKG